MKNILLLTLLTGNGGIASWSKKFINTFSSLKYEIVPVDRSVKGRAFDDVSILKRICAGYKEYREIHTSVKKTISEKQIDILQTTTSGSLGTIRDYKIGKLCIKKKIKCIMHCRYGCITEDIHKPLYGWFLVKTMSLYNQIWVLDNRSWMSLRQIPSLKDKVFVVPNSIDVKENVAIAPANYNHIAFIGNLVPDKGIFELVYAVTQMKESIKLSIVGTAKEEVLERIKEIAGDKLGNSIVMYGQVSNEDAVRIMDSVDILALPTYYPWEAFPISILEAMSLGKLVISTRRGAIEDMLTDIDGKPCGVFVEEKSTSDIVDKIKWILENKKIADMMRLAAYNKVYYRYRTEVVYKKYVDQYNLLLDE